MTEDVMTPEVMIEQINAPIIATSDAEAVFAAIRPVMDNIEKYGEFAATIHVQTEQDAVEANEVLKAIAKDAKAVTEAIVEHKREAQRRHKLFTQFEAFFTDPLDKLKRQIKQSVIDWQVEENRKAEAERARLQAIADEQARKERERLEKQAEKLKTPEKQQERLEQAAQVVAPTIHIEAPKSGVRMAKVWVATVSDQSAFFAAIAQRPDLAGYVDISTTKLARAKSANPLIDIPGITFTQEIR